MLGIMKKRNHSLLCWALRLASRFFSASPIWMLWVSKSSFPFPIRYTLKEGGSLLTHKPHYAVNRVLACVSFLQFDHFLLVHLQKEFLIRITCKLLGNSKGFSREFSGLFSSSEHLHTCWHDEYLPYPKQRPHNHHLPVHGILQRGRCVLPYWQQRILPL